MNRFLLNYLHKLCVLYTATPVCGMKYFIPSLDWILLEMIREVRFSWINLSIRLRKRKPPINIHVYGNIVIFC